MAWETGTAKGSVALMDKLMTFLSSNPDLVAAGQNWEVLRNSDLPFPMEWNGRVCMRSNPGYFQAIAGDNLPINLPSSWARGRYTGTLNIPAGGGTYTFSIRTTSQMRVKIDGKLVAGVYGDNASSWPYTYANDPSQHSGGTAVALTGGAHKIEIEFTFASVGSYGSMQSLAWKRPGDTAFRFIDNGDVSGMTGAWDWLSYVNLSPDDMDSSFADKEYVVKGPGLAGKDEIYMGIRTISSYSNDLYNVAIRYLTGFDGTKSVSQGTMPGATNRSAYALMWNQDIKYWFVAIAKVSTVYASMYGGFILPYGLPSEIPYPIAAGASCSINARWSYQHQYGGEHTSFWNPSGSNSQEESSLHLRRTDGSNDPFRNITWSTTQYAWTYPYRGQYGFGPSPDRTYAIQPIVLFSTVGGGNIWGEFDGAYHISGFNNASENTITIDGKTYLIVQSAYRTGASDYAAILLE